MAPTYAVGCLFGGYFGVSMLKGACCFMFRDGRHLPSQVWNGQDCRVRAGHPAAAGADRRAGVGADSVPHSRTGLPNLEGVRALLQVHVRNQGGRFLRRSRHHQGKYYCSQYIIMCRRLQIFAVKQFHSP